MIETRIEPDLTSFVMLDADGRGRKLFYLPNNAYVRDLASEVSPDGEWIAYHTGSVDYERGDLELNLFHIPDGSSQTIARLVSESYPKNIDELGGLLSQSDPEQFLPETDWSLPILWTFYEGIYSLDWSPDGRYLAFAGQVDGLSSDVYIFDVETKAIQRFTDDLYNVGYIDWSPEGEWIGIFYSIPGINGGIRRFEVIPFTADLNNKPAIYEIYARTFGWIAPHINFSFDQSDGCCGPFNLRYVDAQNNHLEIIWEQSTAAYSFDPEMNLFAISNAPEMDDPGTYLVDLTGKSQKISDDIFWNIAFLGGEKIRFLGFDSSKVVGITESGDLIRISDKPFSDASISPDRHY